MWDAWWDQYAGAGADLASLIAKGVLTMAAFDHDRLADGVRVEGNAVSWRRPFEEDRHVAGGAADLILGVDDQPPLRLGPMVVRIPDHRHVRDFIEDPHDRPPFQLHHSCIASRVQSTGLKRTQRHST